MTKQYDYFCNVKPGESFSVENDDGSVTFCYKILVGEQKYECCLMLKEKPIIEFCCPNMLILR